MTLAARNPSTALKIAFITPGFSASEADWCIPVLLDLVRVLARRHEVHVFTLRYPAWRRRYRVYGATVWSLGGDEAAKLARIPLLGRALAAIAAAGRDRTFDVVHGLWSDEPGFLAALAGRILGRPSVVSILGGELVWLPAVPYGGWRGLGRHLSRWSLAAADRVTVGSYQLAAIAARRGIDRVLQLPLGVETARFRPIPLTAGPLRLLSVGSLVPVKDQATLLKAFARVVSERPDTALTIAGDGPLRESLARLAGALRIDDRLTWLGDVAHDALAPVYAGAHVHVVSSRYESQSLAALEAAASGRPTAGTAVGIVPQLGLGGVPAGDSEALAGHILSLADSYSHAGEAAAALVRSSYCIEQTAERLERLYQDLGGYARNS